MTPMCGRCNKRHFNFLTCETAAKRARLPDYVGKRSVPEGYREWGDKLESWDRVGNTFWRKRETDAPKETA